MGFLKTSDFGIFKVYMAFYSRARAEGSRTLYYKRPDLEKLLGTGSSGTVTRNLEKGVVLGLFQKQSFNFKSAEVQAGTYIHIMTPW